MSTVLKGQKSNNLSTEMYDELFQDSTARYSRPAIFSVPTHRIVVISYRRLGITYLRNNYHYMVRNILVDRRYHVP